MSEKMQAVEELILEITDILDGEVHEKCDYHGTYLAIHDLVTELGELASFGETTVKELSEL